MCMFGFLFLSVYLNGIGVHERSMMPSNDVHHICCGEKLKDKNVIFYFMTSVHLIEKLPKWLSYIMYA